MRHPTHISALSLLALLAGCDLPPIPLEPGAEDQGAADLGREPDVAGTLCEANTRGCFSDSQAYVCNATGSLLSVISCGAEERCEEGTCAPVENTCAPGELLRITPNELVFETPSDLKAQTAQVTLTNCSTHPARLQVARVEQGPTLDDGSPVFAFDAIAPQGLELPPGESFDVKVLYQPRAVDYQDSAQLKLQVQELGGAQASATQVAALRTRALCISAGPHIELGIFEAGVVKGAAWPITNCGSEPVRIEALELAAGGQAAPEVLLLDPLDEPVVGAVLEPGASVMGRLFVQRDEIGPLGLGLALRAAPVFASQPPLATRLTAMAQARGFVRAPGACAPGAAPALRILGEPEQRPSPWRLEPFEPLVIGPEAAAAWMYYEVAGLADTSLGLDETRLALYAARAGDYTVRGFAFDGAGVMLCEPSEAGLDVWPTAPLYAELTWETDGDAVPDDEGAGLGADLDLYVHIARGAAMTWRDPATTCAAPLVLADPFGFTPCADERGALISTSMSGAGVEAIQLNGPRSERVDLGVRLVARPGARAVTATLRVWRDGALKPVHTFLVEDMPTFALAGSCDLSKPDCAFFFTPIAF